MDTIDTMDTKLRYAFWEVFLHGQWKDTVTFTTDCDAEYVRRSLINHDGFDPAIKVRRKP